MTFSSFVSVPDRLPIADTATICQNTHVKRANDRKRILEGELIRPMHLLAARLGLEPGAGIRVRRVGDRANGEIHRPMPICPAFQAVVRDQEK